MISAEANASAVLANLKMAKDSLGREVNKAMSRLAIMVQAEAKDNLSGRVLKVRSNNLRSSIYQKVEQVGDSFEAVIGSGVVYAARHEYGFKGVENVKEHLRRSKGQMAGVKRDASGAELSSSKLNARVMKLGVYVVKAHTRNVDYPAHSYLRTALKAIEPKIKSELEDATREAFRGFA